MQVICISGKAGHGKDTLANKLKSILTRADKSVMITHYADLVKYICTSFFDWDGKKDLAGRSLLQRVGTEMFRSHDENYWVNFICTVLKVCGHHWDFVLIPDCRFPNEITRLREEGFDVVHLRVERPNYDGNLSDTQKAHSSETALDDIQPDAIIMNSGSVSDLARQSEMFLKVNFGIEIKKQDVSCVDPWGDEFITDVVRTEDIPYSNSSSPCIQVMNGTWIIAGQNSTDSITVDLSDSSVTSLGNFVSTGTDYPINYLGS